MKREAEAGAMTGSGGPTSPHKRYRQGDDELRLLIPSKVSVVDRYCIRYREINILSSVYNQRVSPRYTDNKTITKLWI